jgi:hypothetical protein
MLRSKPNQFAIGSDLVLEPLDGGGGLRLGDRAELDRRALSPAAPPPVCGLGEENFRSLEPVRLVVAFKRMQHDRLRLV